MKKVLFIVMTLAVITGCQRKYTCTDTITVEGEETYRGSYIFEPVDNEQLEKVLEQGNRTQTIADEEWVFTRVCV